MTWCKRARNCCPVPHTTEDLTILDGLSANRKLAGGPNTGICGKSAISGSQTRVAGLYPNWEKRIGAEEGTSHRTASDFTSVYG